jgi:hypothetical protein
MSNVYEAFGEDETVVLTDLLREYLGKFWLLKSDAHGGLLKSYAPCKVTIACEQSKVTQTIFFSDEETAFEYVSSRKIDTAVQKLLRETWKDNFELVGEQLLQKIESKQSDLVPLEDPT